jgi:cell division protein ZapA (FtsZ GTPase activity inhibitor)
MEEKMVGINLIIDGISYPLTVTVSEEPYFRKAAHILNDTLLLYKPIFAEQGGVKVMTMAALHIALELVRRKDEVGSAEIMGKVSELSRLIDATLSEKK